jgi:gamma-glutamyltranspeptidase/glutathione hydrolase
MIDLGMNVQASGEGGYQAVLFQRDPTLTRPRHGGSGGDPPVNGVYRAASDFRKDGQAVGW